MRTVNEKAMERAAKVLPSTALEPVRASILTTTGEICQEASFQMIGEREVETPHKDHPNTNVADA
jgi:hypothetical protein